MPQVFQTLRCYKCLVFQVHQSKKSNKWECKMCGEKQSIKRHYGIGSAKDCRLHVQKLNGARGDIENNSETSSVEDEITVNNDSKVSSYTNNKSSTSKWVNFIDESEVNSNVKSDNEETMYLDNIEVVLEKPKKNKKFALSKEINLDDTTSELSQKCNKPNYLDNDTNIIKNTNPEECNETKIVTATSILNNQAKNNLNNSKLMSKNNSKWAQYLNEDDCSNDELTPKIKISNNDNKQRNMFLFEDENIGDILDF